MNGTAAVIAVDEPTDSMAGKVMIIKAGKLAKFVAKPAVVGGTFALPSSGNAPTTQGGQLRLIDLGDPDAADVVFGLPAGGWKGLGNPAGAKGYKYKGAGSPADPCKVVLVKEKIIKAVCKGAAVDLAQPLEGVACEQVADPGKQHAAHRLAQILGDLPGRAFGRLQRNVAGKPLGDDHVDGAFADIVALDEAAIVHGCQRGLPEQAAGLLAIGERVRASRAVNAMVLHRHGVGEHLGGNGLVPAGHEWIVKRGIQANEAVIQGGGHNEWLQDQTRLVETLRCSIDQWA